MSYPLKSLHVLIHGQLHPAKLLTGKSLPTASRQLCQSAITSIEEISADILEQIITAGSLPSQQAVVQTCQIGSIAFLNRLHSYRQQLSQQESKAAGELVEHYKNIEAALLSLLQYLQRHFPSLFDRQQLVPSSALDEQKAALKGRIEALDAQLSASPLAQEQTNIILHPLNHFLSTQNTSSTYTATDYLTTYLHRWELAVITTGSLPSLWQMVLIELNYNHSSFITHCLSSLREEATASSALLYQLGNWSAHLTTINQLQHRYGIAFHPSQPSVKETLLTFIQTEIDTLLKKIPAESITKPATNLLNAESIATTPLSVTQLAVMLRLFNDCALLKTGNQTALFKSLSQSIRTDKTTRLSADSLRSKYYTPEPAAISIVKDHLFQMLNHLKRCNQLSLSTNIQ